MTSGVYAISRISDSARFYIGSAACFQRRWNSHKSRLRAGSHHSLALQRAWNKYGEQDFEFAMLEKRKALAEADRNG